MVILILDAKTFALSIETSCTGLKVDSIAFTANAHLTTKDSTKAGLG